MPAAQAVQDLMGAGLGVGLQECLDQNPELQQVTRLTLRDAVKCLALSLWDEERGKLVSFREAAV